MAKENCGICGKEIGLVSQIQLGDRTYICRDCKKKAIKYFVPLESSLEQYKEHQKQMEDGQKLYDAYFKKNRKVKKFAMGSILVDKDTALICIWAKQGGFLGFGATKQYLVYRVADISVLQFELDPKAQQGYQKKIRLGFNNVSGLSSLVVEGNEVMCNELKKYVGEVINGKGIAGIKNTFRQVKDNMNQAASIGENMQKMMNGEEEGASGLIQDAQNRFYAERGEACEKADAAIAKVLG